MITQKEVLARDINFTGTLKEVCLRVLNYKFAYPEYVVSKSFTNEMNCFIIHIGQSKK